MKNLSFTGFLPDSEVSFEGAQGNDVVLADVSNWGALGGLARFAEDQWTLSDEPSVTGDVVVIDFQELPVQADHTAEFFEILKDDGATQTVEIVLMGPLLDRKRRIRVPAGQSTSIQVRVVWKEDATGFEMVGMWSEPKSMTPTLGAPSLTVVPTRTSAIAPAGIQFEAELAGTGELRPFHDVRYRWVFPETGDYTALPADFEWSRERQVDFGPVTAFTFEQVNPAAEVICQATFLNPVTGQNQTVTQSVTVNIEDPDTVFAFNTITVGDVAQGDDYNAADIQQLGAFQVLGAAPAGSDWRVSLRRGLTYPNLQIDCNFGAARIAFSTHGTGANPVVGNLDIRQLHSGGELSFVDLDAVGPYDPTDPLGTTVNDDHFYVLYAQVPVTIHNCTSIGSVIGVYSGGEIVVSNCSIRDWFGYGTFCNQGHASFIGTSIRQHPLIQRKGDNKLGRVAPFHADHGPFRAGGEHSGPSVFSKCDVFTNGNWADDAQPQNPIRWNTDGDLGQKLSMNMVQIEGGGFGFGVIPTGTYSPQDVVCDRIHHINTGPAREVATITLGGTTLRNFVMVQPDTPAETFDTIQSVLKVGGGEGSAPLGFGNTFNPVEAYSCAFVDMRSEENATIPLTPTAKRNAVATRINDAGYDFNGEVYLGSNIFFAPNRIIGNQDVTLAPLDDDGLRAPVYPGAVITDLVDISYTGYTEPGKIKSSSAAVTLTGNVSGATGQPYGLDMGDQIAVKMTSVADFQAGETATLSGEATGTLTISNVSARAALIDRFATPADATATFAPLAGSAAIGAATTKVALDDWNGDLREDTIASLARTTFSLGPFEVDAAGASDGGGGPTAAFFEDDFERADASTLGAGWTDVTAGWTVSGNRALSTGGEFSRPKAMLAATPTFNDIEVEFELVTVSQRHEIRLRWDGDDNYVYFLFNTGAGRVDTGKNSTANGKEQQPNHDFVTGWEGVWRITLVGDDYAVYHDGEFQQSGTLVSTPVTSRGVGLLVRDGGCVVDGFKVTSLD